ncbi:aldo/keto reductase [Aeromicrobium sp. Leaf350]|uniref:aldo/keto reductase n=1 Tax=Aeromicrobium sp. Leaf350 TaxID=2876565 RepID=UPI001E484855|nr:aldo/keto reductase [Aeromicrobium sp. Leaf350]
MATQQLGHSGITVSAVGIGSNAFGARVDADGTRAVVDAALDAGVTFFDTADVYSFGASEELLGAALKGRRDEVVIATKFGMDLEGLNGDDGGRRGSPAYVRTAIEASLRRLGTDHVDLYQLHTPDRQTPLEDTLGALDELVQEGLVRAIGSSNFAAWEVADAHWRATTAGHTPFATAQNEYSLYNRAAEVELAPACVAYDVGLLPYFPLAYGLLTGKYRQGEAAPEGTRLAAQGQARRLEGADWARIDALQAFADERGIDLLTLAMGGLAAQPAVASVIAGVSRPEQVAANVAAAAWTPTPQDLEALAEIGTPAQTHTTFAT